MAVYTSLVQQDVEALLAQYNIGRLECYQEISAGIENTNYFVTTILDDGSKKEWVLTLFENLQSHELPYFCRLTRHLEQAGFDVPAPASNRQREAVFCLENKPGVIVPRLSGQSLTQPDQQACAAMGEWLANMHLALQSFSWKRALVRDARWLKQQVERLMPVIKKEEFSVLEGYFRRYQQYQPMLMACAQGTVHGDLFRDNVLFQQGKISGVFDFYHACDATLLFDLAVVANDWTLGNNGRHNAEKLASLTSAYQAIRPWSETEQKAWPYCLELAALRFWLSRLVSRYLPGYQQQSLSGETIKDPDEMKRILLSLADPLSETPMPFIEP